MGCILVNSFPFVNTTLSSSMQATKSLEVHSVDIGLIQKSCSHERDKYIITSLDGWVALTIRS